MSTCYRNIYLHNVDLIYCGVNSIILYKLRYYSINVFTIFPVNTSISIIKLPWISAIPLQGNGKAAIPKITWHEIENNFFFKGCSQVYHIVTRHLAFKTSTPSVVSTIIFRVLFVSFSYSGTLNQLHTAFYLWHHHY